MSQAAGPDAGAAGATAVVLAKEPCFGAYVAGLILGPRMHDCLTGLLD